MDGITDSTKKKVVGWRKRWQRIVNEAKKANLETGRQKKDALETVLADAERAGFPRKAFKLVMKQCDHLDAAGGIRDDIDEEQIQQAFDQLNLALELPGFEAATAEAEATQVDKKGKRGKKAPEPEDDGDTNVTHLRQPEEASA